MQTKFLALALIAASGALAQSEEAPGVGDLLKSAADLAGDKVTSAVGAAGAAITSAAGAAGDDAKSVVSDIKSAAKEGASKVTSAADEVGDKITSKAAAIATAAASKLEAIESKWNTYDGWEEFKSNYQSGVSAGSSAMDEYLKTQQIIPSSAVAAAASDLAEAITEPFASASATPSSDAANDDDSDSGATVPTIALGSLIGVVGIVAGAFLL